MYKKIFYFYRILYFLENLEYSITYLSKFIKNNLEKFINQHNKYNKQVDILLQIIEKIYIEVCQQDNISLFKTVSETLSLILNKINKFIKVKKKNTYNSFWCLKGLKKQLNIMITENIDLLVILENEVFLDVLINLKLFSFSIPVVESIFKLQDNHLFKLMNNNHKFKNMFLNKLKLQYLINTKCNKIQQLINNDINDMIYFIKIYYLLKTQNN